MNYRHKLTADNVITDQKGFSLFEVVIALTIIVILGTVVQLNYRSYKKSVVKDIHVLNSVQYIMSVQNSMLKGTFVAPEDGQTLTIDLGQLQSSDNSIDMSDPSGKEAAEYDPFSHIQIYNNGGTMEFYINLKRENEEHYYIDTSSKQTNVRGLKLNHLITEEDVFLLD